MSPPENPEPSRTDQPDNLETGADRTEFADYPELDPIRLLAVDAAIYTFAIDADTESELVGHLEEVVAAALIAAYAPIAEIARQTTRFADSARVAQLAASARTAHVMAIRVAEVATALQARGDDSANRVAKAASDVADRVAAKVVPGGEGSAAALLAGHCGSPAGLGAVL